MGHRLEQLPHAGIPGRKTCREHPEGTDDDPVAKGRLSADGNLDLVLPARPVQTLVDSPEYVLDGHLAAHVKLRRKTHLDVANPFVDVVPGQFVGHTLQGFRILEHRTGVLKTRQVLHQVGVAFLEDQLRKSLRGLRWQCNAPRHRQVDQGVQSKRTIQVNMKVGFGQRP